MEDDPIPAIVAHLNRKASALNALGLMWLAALYQTLAYEIANGLYKETPQ